MDPSFMELMKHEGINTVYKDKDGQIVVGIETADHAAMMIKKSVITSDMKVEVVGEIVPMVVPSIKSTKDKWRPAPGGVSIGHYNITAGTLGMLVRKKDTGEVLILSNNHVLANSNAGKAGDIIYQPGPYDLDGGDDSPCIFSRGVAGFFNGCYWLVSKFHPNGRPTTRFKAYDSDWSQYVIGNLHSFYPIDFSGGTNVIDAALAKPLEPLDEYVKDEVLGIGKPLEVRTPSIGLPVWKSGRTTGVTNNTIKTVDGTVKVSYGGNLTAIFVHQIFTDNMVSGGDSGSVLFEDPTQHPVGLVFAGSNKISIMNPISEVFKWGNLEVL